MLVVYVEDEHTAREFVTKVLQAEKIALVNFDNTIAALNYIRTNPFDVLLIDCRLPGGPDGLSLAHQARRIAPHCTIIMISAYATREETIEAIRAGVDDFLIKAELTPGLFLRSIGDAVLRRRNAYPMQETSRRTVDDLELDLASRTARWHGEALPLTAAQFGILALLTSHPGKAFNFSELYSLSRGEHLSPQDARSKLKSHVTNLRKKLEQGGRHKSPIANVYGVGFKWDSSGQDSSADFPDQDEAAV